MPDTHTNIMTADVLLEQEAGIDFVEIPADVQYEIDALGNMASGYAQAKEMVSQYETRLKILNEKLEQFAEGNGPVRARGNKFRAEVSEPTSSRFVKDMAGVIKAIGAKMFLEKAKFNVTDLDKLVTPEAAVGLIGFKKGNRKITLHQV